MTIPRRNCSLISFLISLWLSFEDEKLHGKARNQTQNLLISSQKLWPENEEVDQHINRQASYYRPADIYEGNSDRIIDLRCKVMIKTLAGDLSWNPGSANNCFP